MALAPQLQHHRRLQRQRAGASRPGSPSSRGHQQVLRLQGRAEDDVHVGQGSGRGPDDVDAGERLRRRRASGGKAAQASQPLEHPQPRAANRQWQQRRRVRARQAEPDARHAARQHRPAFVDVPADAGPDSRPFARAPAPRRPAPARRPAGTSRPPAGRGRRWPARQPGPRAGETGPAPVSSLNSSAR